MAQQNHASRVIIRGWGEEGDPIPASLSFVSLGSRLEGAALRHPGLLEEQPGHVMLPRPVYQLNQFPVLLPGTALQVDRAEAQALRPRTGSLLLHG